MEQSTLDVWSQFSAQLRSYIRRRVADPADAEDLLQQVFVKVHTHIGTLRDDQRIAPWLYQIARNSIVDYHRSRRQFADIPETLPAEPQSDDDSIAQLAIGLRHMVENVPDIYRQPLLLAEIVGLPQKEVAERLGLSLSAAKSRVQRGRRLLRTMLGQCCHLEVDRRGRRMDYEPPSDCRYCDPA